MTEYRTSFGANRVSSWLVISFWEPLKHQEERRAAKRIVGFRYPKTQLSLRYMQICKIHRISEATVCHFEIKFTRYPVAVLRLQPFQCAPSIQIKLQSPIHIGFSSRAANNPDLVRSITRHKQLTIGAPSYIHWPETPVGALCGVRVIHDVRGSGGRRHGIHGLASCRVERNA